MADVSVYILQHCRTSCKYPPNPKEVYQCKHYTAMFYNFACFLNVISKIIQSKPPFPIWQSFTKQTILTAANWEESKNEQFTLFLCIDPCRERSLRKIRHSMR